MSTLTHGLDVSFDIIKTASTSVKNFLLRVLTKIQEGQVKRAKRMIENRTYPF